LLAIYGRVVAKEPGASLLLVGDGPDRPAYEEFVRHHSFSNVHFLGIISQTELPTYLALADVFVFPTLSDTYGAALAEAMAAEVPVVSSIFAAATQDLVADGVNGYRIIPTLHEASAERVLDLLHLPTVDRAAMGRAAYEVVKHTDVVPSADVMVRFLRSLCAAPVPSGAAADGISASSTGAAG
jgi:glycosyltransferase involved in cell wall biosynthesis